MTRLCSLTRAPADCPPADTSPADTKAANPDPNSLEELKGLTSEDNHNYKLDNGAHLFCPSYRPLFHRLIRSIICNSLLAVFALNASVSICISIFLFMRVRTTPNAMHACAGATLTRMRVSITPTAMHACHGHTKCQHVKHSVMGKNVCVRVCCVRCVRVCVCVFDQWDHPG